MMEQKPENVVKEAENIVERCRHMAMSEKVIAAQAHRMSTHLFGHHHATTPAAPKKFELIHHVIPQSGENIESVESVESVESEAETIESDVTQDADEVSEEEQDGENEQSDATSQESNQEDSTDDEEAQLIQPPKKRARPASAFQTYA